MDCKRIMVVEDESIVSLNLQQILEELGYEVTRVATPTAEEVRRALVESPDLALMDIDLNGEEDGIDIAEIMRTEYCIPVVYLTAYADGETLQRASRTAPFGYLLKPFQKDQLKATIEMALLMGELEGDLHRTREELEQQRALALRADRLRSLGEMAAGVAHELNQPLMGVRALAQHVEVGLERGWKFSETQVGDKMRLIVKQADRMAHIIEHLRQFAREAERPERRRGSVNEIVTSCLELIREQFRIHGLELVTDLGQGLPPVRANPFSLEEVLLNLLSNARDAVAAREGVKGGEGPDILVRTGVVGGEQGAQVRVEVIDQGAGIPRELLGKVFEPFFTTKSLEEGTGLGLPIARSLVEECGGGVAVTSTPGQGTKVTISLPADGGPAEVEQEG